jgi:hypothetical protein
VNDPTLAPHPHNDGRSITTSVLQDAADHAGTDIPGVVGNLVKTLAGQKFTVAKGVQMHDEVINIGRAVAEAYEEFVAVRVLKAVDESRYTLGLAYPAMRADVSRAADGHRDFVGAEALEKCAWEWMRKSGDIGLFHREGTSGHATVVESYIYRGPDWHQVSPVDEKSYLVKSGDWMLGTVWDEYGWQLVKAGLVKGWSPEGGAKRATASPERLALLRSA